MDGSSFGTTGGGAVSVAIGAITAGGTTGSIGASGGGVTNGSPPRSGAVVVAVVTTEVVAGGPPIAVGTSSRTETSTTLSGPAAVQASSPIRATASSAK